MKRETTVTFIGYDNIEELNAEELKSTIRALIIQGADTFTYGGIFYFDIVCARTVNELKAEFPNIRNVLVLPYPGFLIECAELYDIIQPAERTDTLLPRSLVHPRDMRLAENARWAVCCLHPSDTATNEIYCHAAASGAETINLWRAKCPSASR